MFSAQLLQAKAVQIEALVGSWRFGKKESGYTIRRVENGKLMFDGTHASGPVSGLLRPQRESLVAELASVSTGNRVGTIRIRYETSLKTAVSNFRGTTAQEWGKDIVARRVHTEEEDVSVPMPEAEEPRQKMIEPTEPLILVGDCNNWNVDAAKRRFAFGMFPDRRPDGSQVHAFRYKVVQNEFSFQILSATKTWNWRLFPTDCSRCTLKTGNAYAVPVGLLWGVDHRAAQDRNFIIQGCQGKCIDIQVSLAPTCQRLWFDPQGLGTLPPPPVPIQARSRRPQDYQASDLSPLQLVGDCCKWRLEQEGLSFDLAEGSEKGDGDMRHTLCFRMQARCVQFQIVSNKVGYGWRLFPQEKAGMLRRREQLSATIGGEDDGHGHHFQISEVSLTIIVLSVRLRVDRLDFITDAFVSYEVMPLAVPKVGLTSCSTQFPPKAISLFSEEVLHAAQTEAERQEVMSLRQELIRKILWQVQEELNDPLVQHEVLELRRLYPYHAKKTVLALEFDQEVARMAALTDAPAARRAEPKKSEAETQQEELPAAHGEVLPLGAAAAAPQALAPPLPQEEEVQSARVREGNGAEESQQVQSARVREGNGAEESQQIVVKVLIDEDLDLTMEVKVERGATVLDVREGLVRLDPVGGIQLEDVALCSASPGPADAESRRRLHDETTITEALTWLRCCSPTRELLEPQAVEPTANAEATPAAALGPVGAAADCGGEASASGVGLATACDEHATSSTCSGGAAESSCAGSSEIKEDVDPMEKLRKDFETRLQLAQDRLSGMENASDAAGAEGSATSGIANVLLAQTRQQEKAFAAALKVVDKASTPAEAWGEIWSKWRNYSVFNDSDSQWQSVVQLLPSVEAAKLRVAKKYGLHLNDMQKALYWGMDQHYKDVHVHKANALYRARLRIDAVPTASILQRVAQALRTDRCFGGTPDEWYHLVDTSVHQEWMQMRPVLDGCWKEGFFKNWFGGQRGGKFMITSLEEAFEHNCFYLSEFIAVVRDQLQQIIQALGQEGEGLRVDSKVMMCCHRQGDSLPPQIDPCRSRRLTLAFHFSTGQAKPSEGGALQLRRVVADRAGSPLRGGKPLEVPAGGGHWAVYFTQDCKHAVMPVKSPLGRWSLYLYADLPSAASQKPAKDGAAGEAQRLNAATAVVECAVCLFSAGDGITMPCRRKHRLCRECLQTEVRKELVATCPACLNENDNGRVEAAGMFDFLDSDGLEELGCVCPFSACSVDTIDPGAKVILASQVKGSQLNGKLAEAIFYEMKSGCWEVRVFATGQVMHVPPTCLHLADSCATGGSIHQCPCWPGGRGVVPVSLGCRCCVKQGIMDCSSVNGVSLGYPYTHGAESLPFDWNVSSLHAILFFLRHDFKHFFHYNSKTVVKAVNRADVQFDNFASSMHSFLHHHPITDRGKLLYRIDRFRVLCRHAREVRGARPLVFIRYVHESWEFAYIDELYSLLRLWAGGRVRLCVVCMLQTPDQQPKLYRHARLPRVLFHLVGSVAVMDFDPIRRACRFLAHDEAGLLSCETIDVEELPLQEFRDPYTTQSSLCAEGDWLTALGPGERPQFYPDCPMCREKHQGWCHNEDLAQEVSRGDVNTTAALLNRGVRYRGLELDGVPDLLADANSWDYFGRRPLHKACELESKGHSTRDAVRIAASLILANGDPHCIDKSRVSVLSYALRKASPPLLALLHAAAAKEYEPAEGCGAAALHEALELIGEPDRSRLARIVDLRSLRPVGAAELAWRFPDRDAAAYKAEVDEALSHFEQLPEAERKKEMRRLLLEWHPDKNAHRRDLATTIFQYLQANKRRVITR